MDTKQDSHTAFSFCRVKQQMASREGNSPYFKSSRLLCQSWEKGQPDEGRQDGLLTVHEGQIRAPDHPAPEGGRSFNWLDDPSPMRQKVLGSHPSHTAAER